MAERRSKFEIIYDILALIQREGKIKPTHVLYKGNLSYDRLKKYIGELKDKDMVYGRMVYLKKGKTFSNEYPPR